MQEPEAWGTLEWEPKTASVEDSLGHPGLRLWLGSCVPAKAPRAGGGKAEDKEWMDPQHQAGPPGPGQEDQDPRDPTRNLRSLTFSWGHPSRTSFEDCAHEKADCKSRRTGQSTWVKALVPLGTTVDISVWVLSAQKK